MPNDAGNDLGRQSEMTKVAILPIPTEKGGLAFQGVAGNMRSQGSTAGEALDALTTQFSDTGESLLVVVQSLRPDRFFDVAQQQRLSELMGRWQSARDVGAFLPLNEQTELETLVETELRASADRAAALADQLSQ